MCVFYNTRDCVCLLQILEISGNERWKEEKVDMILKKELQLDIMANAFNLSTWEAEAGRISVSLKPAWFTQ